MIKAEHFSFGYPDKELYKDVSFTLEDGRHCALIGSNGTGKSTLVELLRHPDTFLYDGTLLMEQIGRIGYASQFSNREKGSNTTVTEYLSQDFISLQEKIADVCTKMECAEDLDALLEEYQTLLDESEAMDADNYELNIGRQLRLAFLEDKASLELSKLSGGEYKLVQIIRQILRRPGLLIMDEPDVFLDFENLNGLRDLINAYEGTLLVITHNRYILEHCFDQIWHLENAQLQEFDGNFREYNFALLKKKVELQKQANLGAAEVQRAAEMVERLRKEASEVNDPVRGRALKAKVAYLDRWEKRSVKAPFVQIRQPDIRLPDIEPSDTASPLLEVKNYQLAFEKELLQNVTFTVHEHEKVAIVGPNGTGKSTLLRDIWRGTHPAVHYSEQAMPGFFSQLQEETLNEANTIYQEFYDLGLTSPEAVEALLETYCFSPESLSRTISQLSGGEKNLLQLAKLSVGNANLLLLDEPSSHLDTYAQMALEQAIRAYQGAVLMVSHDFYSIANCADTILYVEGGTVRPVSPRAFRKMIYKHHFSKDYLQADTKRKELETKIARLLESGNCDEADLFCQELDELLSTM